MQNIFHVLHRLTEGKPLSEVEQKLAHDLIAEAENTFALAQEKLLGHLLSEQDAPKAEAADGPADQHADEPAPAADEGTTAAGKGGPGVIPG